MALIALGVLSSLLGYLDVLGSGGWAGAQHARHRRLTGLVLSVMMWLALPERPRWRSVLPAGDFPLRSWRFLQNLGGIYVENVVARVSEMNAVFALVLGLVGRCLRRRGDGDAGHRDQRGAREKLTPRALTPFTDDVALTDADRRVYTDYAKAQRHKGFEKVTVTFRSRQDSDDTSD